MIRPVRVGVWAAVSSRVQAGEDKASLEDQQRLGHEFPVNVGGEVVSGHYCLSIPTIPSTGLDTASLVEEHILERGAMKPC